jgi:hypothetical protein
MPTQKRPPGAQTVWGPTRSWWCFNPGPRLDICLDEGVYDFVFHQKTYQFKPNMRIAPSKQLMLAQNLPWRAMLVDYHEDVALLYTAELEWTRPAGVFPMWSARGDARSLLRKLDNYPLEGDPVGMFTGAIEKAVVQPDQEQRIVICNLPQHALQWESVFRDLISAKRDFPHITFHINGQKSITRTLGTGVDSFDHPVTLEWESNGQPVLLLANGRELKYNKFLKTDDHRRWARIVGIEAGSIFALQDRTRKSRRMYAFNLRSLKWSFTNYEKIWSMRVVDETDVDPDDSDSSWIPVDIQYRPRSVTATDKWICDLCSINDRCPFSRPGAVCIVNDSEAAKLADKFKTRNSGDIIDALGSLLGAQSVRAQHAVAAESARNERNPDDPKFSSEVTKILATTFDQGVTLARLVDPNIGAGSGKGRKVINAGLAVPALASATPRELAAGFAKAVDDLGYNVEDLTPQQTEEVLAQLVPSGTMTPHVDPDSDPSEDGDGGDPVAPQSRTLRATPSIDP